MLLILIYNLLYIQHIKAIAPLPTELAILDSLTHSGVITHYQLYVTYIHNNLTSYTTYQGHISTLCGDGNLHSSPQLQVHYTHSPIYYLYIYILYLIYMITWTYWTLHKIDQSPFSTFNIHIIESSTYENDHMKW